MNNKIPNQKVEMFRALLAFYVFGLVGNIPFTFLIYYQNANWTGPPPKFVIPEWFYFAYAFGLPLLISFALFSMFLWNTRYRKYDPYRFSAQQMRFFRLKQSELPDFSRTLLNLGYANLVANTYIESIEFKASRVYVTSSSSFSQGQHLTPHRLTIHGVFRENEWRISFTCHYVSSCHVIGSFMQMDFKNTLYESLEELINTTHLRQFQCNWNWERIDEKWHIKINQHG